MTENAEWSQEAGPDDLEWHGQHVAPMQPGCGLLVWRPERPRADRVRVIAHTCECQETVYELCHAGGLAFVRRICRGGGAVVVHESLWAVDRRIRVMWQALLRGDAR